MNLVGRVCGLALSFVVMLMLVGVEEYCLTIAFAAAVLFAAGSCALAAGASAVARTTEAEAVMATAKIDLRMDLSSSQRVLGPGCSQST
ncbi:unannotated protein [freshwater metagenome]|uniref:Unannotated protein n=1 Tax=freshwater metagenome TaxID=449393 RepID=A0A6J7M1T7_9ZZZZ